MSAAESTSIRGAIDERKPNESMNRHRRILATAASAAIGIAAAAWGWSAAWTQGQNPKSQPEKPKYGFKDTPMLPGGKWHVHDSDRPLPKVIDPGTASVQDAPGRPPADAIVLFDGKDLSKWRDDKGGPAGWKVQNGVMTIAPRTGSITTREEFGDCQLHVEFATPNPPRGRDQGMGNSGVLLFGLYEIQVLDNYNNQTYADGHASAIYGQYPPLVNASRPSGQWQTYDIIFTAPRFKADKTLETPAYATVLHNGVLVHNHAEIIGPMSYRSLPKYSAHGPKGPLMLQDHGDPVRYRNIWIRELKAYDQP